MSKLLYYKRIFQAYIFNRKQSAISFWHTPLYFEKQAFNNNNKQQLGPYYMDFTAKLTYKGPFDLEGVPMLQYFGDIGMQYNACAIAQYGLGIHTMLMRERTPELEIKMKAIAEWYVKHQKNGIWYYTFDWYELKQPWYSGLSQGQSISFLLRAHEYFGEATYLEAAKQAMIQLLTSEEEGGCISHTTEGEWIEEYPRSEEHVLNGYIWAFWSLFDLYRITNENCHLEKFSEFYDTLKKRIHLYDIGYWSIYMQTHHTKLPMVCSVYYQRLHILLLEITLAMQFDDYLQFYKEKWQAQLHNPIYRLYSQFIKICFKLLYK